MLTGQLTPMMNQQVVLLLQIFYSRPYDQFITQVAKTINFSTRDLNVQLL